MNATVNDSAGPSQLPGVAKCPASTAKWSAVVDDRIIPLPQRQITTNVLRSQSATPDDCTIVRDYNSPDDEVMDDDSLIDLAAGNVFYRLARCDVQPRKACSTPPKLAYFVDDRWEITTNPKQTGRTIRDWFNLPAHVELFRDFESPIDQPLDGDHPAVFGDGPVFYTREPVALLRITVNHRIFTEADGVKPVMDGLDIAKLVYPENPEETVVRLHSDGDREIQLDEEIHIQNREVFDVVRRHVIGGYELSRVQRELGLLRAGGANVTLLTRPPEAVVYHGLRTGNGRPIAVTDVLVPIPSGYPGQTIDLAYLPDNSPLIGQVPGKPENQRLTALGVTWRQISYHPHNGGGAPAWNPVVHGFHTYLGELLSWLK